MNRNMLKRLALAALVVMTLSLAAPTTLAQGDEGPPIECWIERVVCITIAGHGTFCFPIVVDCDWSCPDGADC